MTNRPKLSPLERELADERRRQVWAHNQCFGGVAMAKMWMVIIQQKPTVTDEAKVIAGQVEGLLLQLSEQLKKRNQT